MDEQTKKALTDELGGLVAEMRADLDKSVDGKLSTLGEEKYQKVNERIDEIESKLGRALAAPVTTKEEASEQQHKAFDAYLRTGTVAEKRVDNALVPVYMKALSESNDNLGGYLVQPEFIAELIKNIVEISPFRSLARVRQTGTSSIKIPKRTSTFAAAWVAENGTRAETTGYQTGMEEIVAHECYALVDISNALLEDTVFNLEAELRGEFAEQLAKLEGTAFIAGTGSGQPEGILTNTSVSHVASGNANTITADALISLYVTPNEMYAKTGTWLFNRATLGVIRKLKDSQNQYLWQPGLADGTPGTLLGAPYVLCPDMEAVSAGNDAVAFGDFRAGYTIVDRLSLELLRDPYTQATSGNVRFLCRKRTGGQVTKPEAFAKMTIEAS